MNIRWKWGQREGGGFCWYQAINADSNCVLFSVCEVGVDPDDDEKPPYDRWGVYDKDYPSSLCGYIAHDLPEEELKAVALVTWRLRNNT